jgi:hypothetical protein
MIQPSLDASEPWVLLSRWTCEGVWDIGAPGFLPCLRQGQSFFNAQTFDGVHGGIPFVRLSVLQQQGRLIEPQAAALSALFLQVHCNLCQRVQ